MFFYLLVTQLQKGIMLTKIKEKISKMTTQDWIAVGLWLLTFVLLLVFVILAAVLDKDSKTTYANALAGVGLSFALAIISALFTTVLFAKQKQGAK